MPFFKSSNKTRYFLSFYADTRTANNKRFKFRINGAKPFHYNGTLKRLLAKGYKIRCAWVVTRRPTGGELQTRII